MPNDAIVHFDKKRAVIGLATLGPQSQPVAAGALGCRQLVARRDARARAVIGDHDAAEGRPSERLLHAKDLPPEPPLRELDPVVDPVLFTEEVLGQRIEKVERVEPFPGNGGHICDAKAGVLNPKPGARPTGDLHEVRALLDAEEGERRGSAGGDEHELSRARAHIENAACPRATKEIRRAARDSHGRPKAFGQEPDPCRVHGIEDGIVGRVRVERQDGLGRKQ